MNFQYGAAKSAQLSDVAADVEFKGDWRAEDNIQMVKDLDVKFDRLYGDMRKEKYHVIHWI